MSPGADVVARGEPISLPAQMWVSPYHSMAKMWHGGAHITPRRRRGPGEPIFVPAQMWAGMDPAACVCVCVGVCCGGYYYTAVGGTIITHTQPSHQPESQFLQTRDLSCAGAHQPTEYSRGTQGVLRGTHGVLSLRTRSRATSPRASSCRSNDLSCAGAHQHTEYSRGTQRVLTGYDVGTPQWGNPFTSAESRAQMCTKGEPILGG